MVDVNLTKKPDIIGVPDSMVRTLSTEPERLEVPLKGGTLIFDQDGIHFDATLPQNSWKLNGQVLNLLQNIASQGTVTPTIPVKVPLCRVCRLRVRSRVEKNHYTCLNLDPAAAWLCWSEEDHVCLFQNFKDFTAIPKEVPK